MIPAERRDAFESALARVPPSGFTETRGWLAALYACLKKTLDRYSYVEFAADLGFGRTNVLFLVIQGRRRLSVKAANRIAENLELKGTDLRYLHSLAEYENGKSPREREETFTRMLNLKSRAPLTSLNKAQLRFFTEWYHPVIRELAGSPGFRSDPFWIADQLVPRIRPRQAAESLELLESLGLLRFDEAQGRHVQAEADLSTGDEIASISVVRFHQQMIELGKQSITTIPEDMRDVSAVLIPADEAFFEKLKLEIRAFRKRILELSHEVGQPDRVVELNMQLFPVTHARRKAS